VRMLEAGGNAVDAAVAAAFALAVAEPTQSGLGGRTQMLVVTAEGRAHGIDGTTQVPAGYDSTTAPRGEHGHGAVAIPGTVAALTRALEAHGTLPLATVLGPALSFARDGIALPAGEARRLAEVAGELDPSSEVARVFYRPGAVPPAEGDTLVQPDLRLTARQPLNLFCHGASRVGDLQARLGVRTHYEMMLALQALGLRVNRPHLRVCKEITELTDYAFRLKEDRSCFAYEIHGVLITLNPLERISQIEETAPSPFWLVAFGFGES